MGALFIQNRLSGKVLDVPGFRTDDCNIQQFTANGGDNQKWKFVSAGGGFWQIVSVSSGKSLTLATERSSWDTFLLRQSDYSASPNQQWKLILSVTEPGSPEYFKILARSSLRRGLVSEALTGYVLDVADGATNPDWEEGGPRGAMDDSAVVQEFSEHDGDNQLWCLKTA